MENIKFVKIPKGKFFMGATTKEGYPSDFELPRVELNMQSFEISETTITNYQFKKFIEDTGYITTAEKYNGTFVFHLLLEDEKLRQETKIKNLEWWNYVEGADWKHPFGPDSNIENILDHPVVHVSYIDALEFCKWGGYRLPTEAEWEYAARAGSEYRWPWGSDFLLDKKHHCNIWQGNFPFENSREDGYLGTAPAKSFNPNEFGLYNVIGNVWEWCSNQRGIPLKEFKEKDYKDFLFNNIEEINGEAHFATRGGSFLCHDSYCNRYRLGARNGNTANSTSSNTGFRVCKL